MEHTVSFATIRIHRNKKEVTNVGAAVSYQVTVNGVPYEVEVICLSASEPPLRAEAASAHVLAPWVYAKRIAHLPAR